MFVKTDNDTLANGEIQAIRCTCEACKDYVDPKGPWLLWHDPVVLSRPFMLCAECFVDFLGSNSAATLIRDIRRNQRASR